VAILGIVEFAAFLFVSFVLMSTGVCQTVRADDEVSLEYQVKAAYLVNFLKFIEWPNAQAPDSICVLGQDPFGKFIDTIAHASNLTRDVEVRRADNLRELQSLNQPCHIIYVSKYDKALPESLGGVPVLTVADEPYPAMIMLSLREGKVRFQIHLPLVESKGMKVSSKLMKLSLPKPEAELTP
jgi:hypothetical protein